MTLQLDVFCEADIQAATEDRAEPVSAENIAIPDWAKDDPTLELGVTPGSFSVEISNADYHAKRDYLSHTGMTHLLRSAKHYLAYLDKSSGEDGDEEKPREKEKVNVFNAFHAAVLEPEFFAENYVTFTGRRQGKVWDEFYQKNTAEQGKIILTKSEMDRAEGLCDSIKAFEDFDLWGMFRTNQNEKSIFWYDNELGLHLRIRVDSLSPFAAFDLKGIDDSRENSARKAIGRMNYDLQAALYSRGIEKFTGNRCPFVFAFVEDKAPHGIWLHTSGQSVLSNGMVKVRNACNTLKRAKRTDKWSSYTKAFSVIEMSKWDMLAPDLEEGEC